MSFNNSSTTFDYDSYLGSLISMINQNITRYGMGLTWIVGNFGSIANFLVFCRPNLRKNPCIMYFLASTVSQFVTFNFALFARVLYIGFDIQTINTILWYCKIYYYFFYVFVATARFFIMLASIDRYFASAEDIYWRSWSSPKIARRLIIISFIIWCLIYIQVLVFYDIHNNECSFRTGAYGIFFSVYLSIESGIFPPAIMLIFELLTLRNIRNSKRKTRPLTTVTTAGPIPTSGMSKKDLQFSKMLFNQICLWLLLNILNPCYLFYRTITINNHKSVLRLTIESFINNISYLFIYFEFSLTFFIYTLSSPLFRREFNQIIRKKILRHNNIPNLHRRNIT